MAQPAPISRAEVLRALGVIDAIAASGADLERALGPALPSDLHGNHALLALAGLEIEGPLRPAQITERTGLTSGGTTKLLDRLERHGFVTRVFGQVPGDRRGSMVELTASGHAAVGELAQGLRTCAGTLATAAIAVQGFLDTLDTQPGG